VRAGLLAISAVLCALPASGSGVQPTPEQIDALSPIDSVPSRVHIDLAFPPGGGLDGLIAIATDPAQDLGVQIRALRALPQYCLSMGCSGTQVHLILVALVEGYRMLIATVPRLPPPEMLRLRAAMEALGAMRSGAQADVDLLTSPELLGYPSRDVKVTAVHALRGVCSPDLCSHEACAQSAAAVRALRTTTGDQQIDAAVNSALQELAPCAQP
jgi:hypothetical protein